jgi:hypothetical protein
MLNPIRQLVQKMELGDTCTTWRAHKFVFFSQRKEVCLKNTFPWMFLVWNGLGTPKGACYLVGHLLSHSATTRFSNLSLWVPAAYHGHLLNGEILNLLQAQKWVVPLLVSRQIPHSWGYHQKTLIQLNFSHIMKTTTENTNKQNRQ